jgi:N-methylhydantoinase A/oxoprolinase/acetone carboxylase beta subunit
MQKEYVIGIDIGGTHTDAVLIDSNKNIVKKYKTETSADLEEGVKVGLEHLIQGIDKKSIRGIFVGTTHATNAVVENKNLYRVGVIRIAGHHPKTLNPCFSWPDEIRKSVYVGAVTIDGGFECDSRPITPFNPTQAREAVEKLIADGAESLAIIGVFSPICADDENACGAIANEITGGKIPITLSHQIGGVGFIERENAAILNAALKKPMEKGFRNLEKVKNELKITNPLFVTQNDGSIIDIKQAIAFPLLTISSGPTNSFIGASKLAGLEDALIIDIGGTTSDIGIILNGYPRRSMHNTHIGGITLNFRMPDVMALAIGGGTYVDPNPLKIGPQSCGRNLFREAQIFGGSSLTLTDVACLAGCMNIEEGSLDQIKIEKSKIQEVMKEVSKRLRNGLQVMRGERKGLPVIIVGGGAGIGSYEKTENSIVPEHSDVANAYGAALAEISATVDTVVSLNEREKTLDELKERAIGVAVSKGADKNVTRIVDVLVIPYHYIPNNLARVIVIASGQQK